MNPIRNNLVLELHVPDFALVKEFYGKLGFAVVLEDASTEEFQGYLTLLRKDELGDTMLNFYGGDERVYQQSHFKQFPRDTTRGYGVEITIPASDLVALHARVKSLIPQSIVRELKEMQDNHVSWKDFRLTDPFGYYIRFTDLVNWGQ